MTVQTQAPTLRLALLPRAGLLTDALLVCAGAGLIAGSAQISVKLPFTPVPITGQTFSVLLVGATLGTMRGGASALLYVLAGLLFPVYAPHTGYGFATITSASGGYLISYPFVSALTGYLAERRWDRTFSSAVGAMLTGNVLIYLFGLPWLAVVLNTNLEKTLEDGLYPFVPGDIFKLYLAAAALPGAWRLVGRLRR
jgi:biotin transport system substrate-specific component